MKIGHPQKKCHFQSMNFKVRNVDRFREGTVFNFGKSVGRSWKIPTGDLTLSVGGGGWIHFNQKLQVGGRLVAERDPKLSVITFETFGGVHV